MLYYIKSATPHNYADDNKLSAHAKTEDALIKKLEQGANEAVNWLTHNEMIANPGKFQAILLKKDKSDLSGRELNIDSQIIKTKNEVESLGLIIDNKMSFKMHISNLCKSASGKLNALKRLSNYMNENTRKYFATSYVLSEFVYCSTVWHFCGLVETHKIEKIHQRALRFIYSDYTTPYHPLIASHNLTTIYGKRVRAICCKLYKTNNNLNPEYMHDIFESRPSNYPTRKPYDMYVPKANQISFGYNSLRIEGPKLWNLLPEDIKNASDIITFKKKLDSFDFPFCNCTNDCLS